MSPPALAPFDAPLLIDFASYEERFVRGPLRRRVTKLLSFESAQDGCHTRNRVVALNSIFPAYVDGLRRKYDLRDTMTSHFGCSFRPADRAARAIRSLSGVNQATDDKELPWSLLHKEHWNCGSDACVHHQEVRVIDALLEHDSLKLTLHITFVVDQFGFSGNVMQYRE